MATPLIGRRAAVLLVFATSAAVLVLEILAGRLLAPYVGVSLETYTGIIGTILAAIAFGTAVGGRLADRLDPRRLLGPSLIAGGALAWLSLPALAALGPGAGEGPAAIVLLTTVAFFLPAAVLSAISPMVAKLRLDDVAHTGEVVGGLSAAGTAGALVGTFLTGFVLVAAWPTRPIVLAIGAALVLSGLLVWFRHASRMPRPGAAALTLAVVVGSGGLAAADTSPCRWETAYFCITIERDLTNPSGRVLWLDTLRHSYVDLDDPSHLEFRYIRLFDDVASATMPEGPLDALHLGGGGFTFPRHLDAARPGSTNLVLEIDDELVRIAEDHLDLEQGPGLRVVTGDARLALDDLDDDAVDLVVGDAFGGLSVPWHLTTREVVEAIDRVMRPDGVYVANVIDGGSARFARAQAATLAAELEHVAVILPPTASGGRPVNHVLVASDAPLDALLAPGAVPAEDGRVLTGGAAREWIGDAEVLTDDHAPVDQLLTRRP
ncbi:fused MFS/spermidine synthase [Actinomarinicola tropica]|uniref:Spermidine synthase n=1 Tax=Actinomarinicola tropica TaxID=2789776 RepID=A0A5Q2RLP9_9ACTN|nr:fused MFS/spermidine synthase [Actinomarinicola tropica]QGG94780.1 spermidine synthase [Actinomarinicola tropica]